MREAEARGLAFLFKLRLTANVKRMIEKLASSREWVCAGQGFEAKESEVRLTGFKPAAARDRVAQAAEGRSGGFHIATMAARRSLRSSRSAQRRKSTNTRFWSLRSTRKQRRSVSSIATGATARIFSTR